MEMRSRAPVPDGEKPMEGDKLIIKEHHTRIAREIVDILAEQFEDKFVISVGGESGAGKSEIASELSRIMNEDGIVTKILQQDDYFVFPPKTNHEMRKINLRQVGMYEVKLDFLEANLRSFKQGDRTIYKPLVSYEEDRITTETLDVYTTQALIVEGTYVTRLNFVDRRVFLDRTYLDTEKERRERKRDTIEDFIGKVLETEHRIVSAHKSRADIVVRKDFSGLETSF